MVALDKKKLSLDPCSYVKCKFKQWKSNTDLIQFFKLHNLMENVIQYMSSISGGSRQLAGNSQDITTLTNIILKIIFST